MLELERASAGSGKTYTLAKKFIWYFITISDEGKRRLRTPAELTDSLSHILAVTFTNKATNEMQQRIVEKLNALANPPQTGKKPDYMEDFCEELRNQGAKVEEYKISDICKKGLSILLNHYSDFHVSTIDSFFQQVLRTFAYESDISDSYQLELNGKYLSTVAIDTLLEDLNTGSATSGTKYWMTELISREKSDGHKWNIFTKQDKGSPYGDLISSVERLENEEFKEIREDLDEYFQDEERFRCVYEDLRERYSPIAVKSFKELQQAARNLGKLLNSTDIHETDKKSLKGKVNKILGMHYCDVDEKDDYLAPLDSNGSYVNRRAKHPNPQNYEMVEKEYSLMSEAYDAWRKIVGSNEYRHWNLYYDKFPFLGMLQAVREARKRYLDENNAVELGETNSMLRKIIGEDDTPFIYERIGTRLNHYLIDEFQDTSKLQWQNMLPLLRESEGRGHESLIIGDAKQSIYRFRNADSTLISTGVEKEFDTIEGNGVDPVTNTNWRSDCHIVQFNNSFFSYFSERLTSKFSNQPGQNRVNFQQDFQNVVQELHKREPNGYVELRVWSKVNTSEWEEFVLENIIKTIEDVLSRGYRQGDIAILVNKNDEGEAIIEELTRYNNSVKDASKELKFVSEQSLKLSSSAAVSMIESVLETISRGAKPEIREGEERRKRGVADWGDISCNFRFFMLRHPQLTVPECLEEFFRTGSDNDAIGDMLTRMQAVSIPALIESIVAEFLDAEIRRKDAVFISAFQDLALEYCGGYPSDIASFLKWWSLKKKVAAISSSKGDDIQIMTIHKSKGLEFPVVLVPFTDQEFEDKRGRKEEWRWVKPMCLKSECGELPPYLPISTASKMEKTAHEHKLYEYYDSLKMDHLNKLYVAFTRAEHELYIFAQSNETPSKLEKGQKDTTSIAYYLMDCLESYKSSDVAIGDSRYMLPGSINSLNDKLYTYGVKYAAAPYNKEEEDNTIILEDYPVRATPEFMLYRESGLPDVKEAEELEDKDAESINQEDIDPRAEGNLLHAIMENVDVVADIPKSIRKMEIKGLLTKEQGEEFKELLLSRVEKPEIREWFSGNYKVINERSLIHNGTHYSRPDRVMLSPSGYAIVVDYKFGQVQKVTQGPNGYSKQVKGYVDKLKDTGKFRGVKGYLWYVKEDKLELVSD